MCDFPLIKRLKEFLAFYFALRTCRKLNEGKHSRRILVYEESRSLIRQV